MSGAKSQAKRIKLLKSYYGKAKQEGVNNGFDICQIDPDDYEQYYILLKPQTGLYRDQNQIIHMKTTYGDQNQYVYPQHPPYLRFVTRVYHTNISTEGTICLDILKQATAWSQTYDFIQIIMSIILLYQEPNTNSAFNSAASRDYSICRKQYNSMVCGTSTVKEKNDAEQIAFADYKKLADKYAGDDWTKFTEWFPALIGEQHSSERLEHFAELQTFIDSEAEKKKKQQELLQKATSDKAFRWKKFQKK